MDWCQIANALVKSGLAPERLYECVPALLTPSNQTATVTEWHSKAPPLVKSSPQPAEGADSEHICVEQLWNRDQCVPANRYYASNLGRWTSPDWSANAEPVPYAKLDNPQSLNLYGYVGNNPLSRVDPDGHMAVYRCDHCVGNYGTELEMGEAFPESAEAGFRAAATQQQAQKAQQTTLPDNPSGLGDGWKDVTPQGGRNPKISKRYRGPKGSEIEFDPANPGKSPKTWGGKNHWHGIGPDGKREDGHLAPGSAIPGPDGVASRSVIDRMKSITPGPILKLGTAGVIIYIIIDEGSRFYPPRNLVPVP